MYRYYRAKMIPNSLWCDLPPLEWLLRKMERNEYMQTATWLVSRELTEAAGPWNAKLLGDDDGEYFCRVLLASDGVRFVPDARVYYRTPWFTSLGYVGESNKKMDALWESMKMHIRYLRSMEESTRVGTACVRYLQTAMILFYPERPDIVQEAQSIARDLGGQLTPPVLSWKYAWIKAIFGWAVAKQVRRLLPIIRWTAQRQLDGLLFHIARPEEESRDLNPELESSKSGAPSIHTSQRSHHGRQP